MGERMLQACTRRHLAGELVRRKSTLDSFGRSAGCRTEHAGGMRSPSDACLDPSFELQAARELTDNHFHIVCLGHGCSGRREVCFRFCLEQP
jgi:hypothetical protein